MHICQLSVYVVVQQASP